jgi:uncharacterized damage-inducible protein DinB
MSKTRAAVESPRTAGDVSVRALTTMLTQLRDVIGLLPVQYYRAQPAARVSGSVGAHVRHTLDHISALIAAIEGRELRYDDRRRGTTVEIDPLTGANEIDRLLYRIDHLAATMPDVPITLSTLVDPHEPPAIVRTTLARELAFVVQHTVHHCALIAVLLEWQGYRVPYGFGLAASTQRARALAS